MKRAPSLQDLSRDHHQALIQAQRLRRVETEEDARRALADVRAFATVALQPHFEDEERILLPHLDETAGRRMKADHDWLLAELAAIEVQGAREPGSLPLAHRLGRRLHDHVRFEEDVCFESLQGNLSAADQAAIGAALAARRQGRADVCAVPGAPGREDK